MYTRSLIRALASHLNIFMSVKLLTEHHLKFLSLKGGCTGSSESTLVKMPQLLEITCHGSLPNCFQKWFWLSDYTAEAVGGLREEIVRPYINRNCLGQFREIPWNQTKSFFYNAGDNVTLMLYNVTLTSHKPY